MTRMNLTFGLRGMVSVVAVAAVLALPAMARAHCGTCEMGGDAKHGHQDKKTIVDVAASAGSFNTLVAAVKAAGLVEALSGEGPLTVFAPTDEAFAKLPAGTVESLLKPENKARLVSILTYHVVAGKVTAADVVKLDKAATLQGQSLAIKVVDGKVHVDEATVIKADVHASNGVIHVIDTVVLPE